MQKDLAALAERLRALHHGSEPLVLPNAWDAASARGVQDAGFPAVATGSAGVTSSLGFEDGQKMPPEEMFAAVSRIANLLDVPLTADLEAGYDLQPEEFVRKMLEAGAVGCNLEDTNHSAGKALRDAQEQASYLKAVKQAGKQQGVDIVVNARVDVFIRRGSETAEDIDEAVRRAELYLQAGADCIYPILIKQETTIEQLVQRIKAPINIYAMAGAPPLSRIKALGVKRISFAARLQRMAMADLQRRLEQIKSNADPA